VISKQDTRALVPVLKAARVAGYKLTSDQQYQVVKQASQPFGVKNMRDMREEAFIIYHELREKNQLTEPILAELIARAAYDRGTKHLGGVVELYADYGFVMTSVLWNRILTGLFHTGNNSKSARYFFSNFKLGYVEHGWRINRRTFRKIFQSYISDNLVGGFRFLPEVLDVFVQHGTKIDNQILDEMLTASLHRLDSQATEAIMGIGLKEFMARPNQFKSHFNRGRITRLLQTAAVQPGQPMVARVALEWATTVGVEPREVDMALWVRSALAKKDFKDAIEVLVLTKKTGLDLRSGPYGGWLHREFVLQLQGVVTKSRRRAGDHTIPTKDLDSVYNNLLDLARSDWQIPALALDSIITCAGMVGNTDRAFATFDEYSELFGLERDVTAYNALMEGVSFQGFHSVQNLLAIMARMEEDEVEPNGTSFSCLFTAMAPGCTRIPPQEIDLILDMMEEKGCRPLPFTIARLAQILSQIQGEQTQTLVARMNKIFKSLTGFDRVEVKNEKFDEIPGCYKYLLVNQHTEFYDDAADPVVVEGDGDKVSNSIANNSGEAK
jgi:hypothetical protein